MILIKSNNNIKNIITKSLIISIIGSSFIYLEYFSINIKAINSILALIFIYYILTINKKIVLFLIGFFTSILWFWWIGISFKYYDLNYLIPFITILIGIIYGVIFYCFSIINNNIYIRALCIFIFSYIYPFNFNWFQIELLFINSHFGITKLHLILILLSMILLNKLKNRYKILFIIPLLISIYLSQIRSTIIQKPNIKISTPQLNVDQNIKWKFEYKDFIIENNIKLIDNAIKNNYDLIILPESAFPIVLNDNKKLLSILKEKSTKINIVTGSLYRKNGLYYNSTYYFSKKNLKIANKIVLVPFGEAIPLPQQIRNLLNNTFYNGAKDYERAKKPTTFNIKGIKFRSAICYEATTNQIFKDLKDTKYMIAISNNAWFKPSIQHIIQNLLLKYYAKKYNIMIYHVSNSTPNKIIKND